MIRYRLQGRWIPLFDLVIFVDTSTDVHIKRLEENEYKGWGNSILPGGDMYDKHTAFIEWAKSYDTAGAEQRSRVLHMQWMEKLSCPIITVDGTLSTAYILSQLHKFFTKQTWCDINGSLEWTYWICWIALRIWPCMGFQRSFRGWKKHRFSKTI